jgi:hypothetical protein
MQNGLEQYMNSHCLVAFNVFFVWIRNPKWPPLQDNIWNCKLINKPKLCIDNQVRDTILAELLD